MCQNDSNLILPSFRLMMAQNKLFIMLLPLIFSIPNIYADEQITNQINGSFDWLNNIVSENINDTGFESDTQTNLQDTVDSGSNAGKKGVDLWFSAHEFLVDLIFSGISETELPVDKDIIVILSMIIVAILGMILVKKLLHEDGKVVIIIVFIILITAYLGLNIVF